MRVQTLLRLILIVFIVTEIEAAASLELHVHQWCPPCRKAKAIFQKVAKSFPQIDFIVRNHSNKQILFARGKEESPSKSLPFPTLILNCDNRKFTYQNDLNIKELSHWIQALCLHRVPTCTHHINEDLYRLPIKPPSNEMIDPLITAMEKYPHIKVCSARHANRTAGQAHRILQKEGESTLYFDHFSHNIRNYLIKSSKLAIALISNHRNTTKTQSFFETFLAIQTYANGKPENLTLRPFQFELSDAQKMQLLFLELCLNNNVSRCYQDPLRKQQVTASQSITQKLLNFVGIPQTDGELEYIIAFRFKENKFETSVYEHSLGILDEKFLFWISEILSKDSKVESKKDESDCVWNSLIHRVQQGNLEDIQTHLMLRKALEEQEIKHFSVSRQLANYHWQSKFTLCQSSSQPQHFHTNLDLARVLQIVRRTKTEATNNIPSNDQQL